MKIFRFLILILLLPSMAIAGWLNKQGEPMPDSENRKSKGDFGAHLVLVGDEEELFRSWDIPSDPVYLKTIDSVKINDFITAVVIFSGCKADKNGNCNVTMKFRVVQPDNKDYTKTPPMEVWVNKPAPTGYSLQLSVDYLKIQIEPGEQLGKYIIYTQVTDNNSGTLIDLQSPFTAFK